MELREYLRVNGLTQEGFAANAGLTQPTISNIVNRVGSVSLDIALRIEHLTMGDVLAKELPISKGSQRSLRTIGLLARSGAFQ